MKAAWEKKKFEDCIQKVPKTKQVQTSEYNSGTQYPIISQEDKLISGFCDDESMLYQIENPIVIFGDHTRVLKYIDFDFIVGADGVKIILPKEFLNAKYLYHYLKWFNVPSLGYSRHYKLLKEISIPVPPIDEQVAIVSELDSLSSIIAKHKQLAEEYDRLEQSIFHDMFGDPVTNEKGWEVKKLGDVCEYAVTRTISENVTIDNYVGVENLLQNYQGKTIASKVPDNVGLIEYHKYDVLVGNIRPYLKKIWLATEDGGCNGDVLAFRILQNYNNKLDPIFLYKCLASESFFEYDMQYAKGEKMPRGDKKMLLLYPMFLPPLFLQQSFASKIQHIESLKAANAQAQKEAELLFAERMNYYFGE